MKHPTFVTNLLTYLSLHLYIFCSMHIVVCGDILNIRLFQDKDIKGIVSLVMIMHNQFFRDRVLFSTLESMNISIKNNSVMLKKILEKLDKDRREDDTSDDLLPLQTSFHR